MNIRPFEAGDLACCAELFAVTFAHKPWNEDWDLADAVARLDEVYRTPGAYGVVAEDDSGVIGFALGYAEQMNREQHFYLKEMCVAPNRQRSGVGAAMMEALCRDLAATGICTIYLLTLHASSAESFYRALGFRASSRMVLMGKHL